jgi:hypothetical protein
MVTYSGWLIQAPDGTTHQFPTADYTVEETGGTSCNHSFTDYTLSGGIKATVSGHGYGPTVTFPNGWNLSATNFLADTFGNQLDFLSGTYTDTLNTTAVQVTYQTGNTGEIDTYTDTTGTARQIKQILTSKTVKTAFGCPIYQDTTLTEPLVTQINFPDSISILLAYEAVTGGVTGRVSQITLRTGGTVSYGYSGMDCTSLLPTTVTRTTADGTTTYTRVVFTGAGGKFGTTTTVLDPGKNRTTYTYMGTDANGTPLRSAPTPLTLTQIKVEQNTGTVASPAYTLLSTTIYCYNGNATACSTTQAAYPITQKDTYTAPGSKTTYSRVKQTFDTYGNVTSVARYDFTTVGGGTPVTTTTITYGSWNGSCTTVGSGIVNLPCNVKTTDSAGHTLAESRHTYSTKGFNTQTQNWTGSLWITSSAAPNANGTVASSTSPLGQVTTYSYAGGCNNLLPTGTSTTVNGVLLTSGAAWDCNGGKLLSSTDTNGGVSHFTYDLLFRPGSQADSTTYETDELYTQTTAQVSDPYVTTTTKVDGLGRTISTQTTDGASYDTISTTYGFTTGSNPQFQISTSQPCIAALNANCTYVHGHVTDPLGRTITSSTTGNENVTMSYNQNDVQIQLTPTPTGELAKTTQVEYDGLGRPKSVCNLLGTGGTACGQVDGGSGILSTYSYSYNVDGSTNVVNVRGGQNHTDVYDSLGRDVSSFRVESGTTSYTYDKTSVADVCRGAGVTLPGLLLKKTNNGGSYECYQYAPDGRLTDIAVADGSGTFQPECRRFRYDATSNGAYSAPTGYAPNNIKGRLMEASTDDCTWPLSQAHMDSDEWFSYDDDGRTAEVWENTAHSGGFYHTTAGYYLNGALHTLSGVPGKSTYSVVLDTEGRPNSSTLGSTSLITDVTYNAAGQTTLFNYGSSGGNDAFTFDDAYTGRMKTYTYSVGAATDKGTLTWNANGTLKTLAIVDGFNAGGTQTCNFTYDDLARLLTDNCGAIWNQSYTYDQYDNFSKSGSTNWNPGYNATNNHITGAGYDGAGRVIYDLNNSYSWDSYGKMASANAGASVGSCGSGGVTCVTYDAFGRPAEKQVAGTFTEFLYSPLGLTAIMNGQTTTSLRLPLPGGALLDVTGGTNKLTHYDWLGSARLITNTGATVLLDAAYTPYGEKYASFGSGAQNFTGDFQDLYAGLFDTPNREFDQAAGSRWLSPDPAHASWNAYSYPTNPNSATDSTGLYEDMNALTPQGPSFESQVSTGCDGGYGCGAMMTNYTNLMLRVIRVRGFLQMVKLLYITHSYFRRLLHGVGFRPAPILFQLLQFRLHAASAPTVPQVPLRGGGRVSPIHEGSSRKRRDPPNVSNR